MWKSKNRRGSRRGGWVATILENAKAGATEGEITLTLWSLSRRERDGFGQ
jgi:hypothetical protein